MTDRVQIAESEHDSRATLNLTLCKGDRLLIVVTAENQNDLT